jgi:hypothetical protein
VAVLRAVLADARSDDAAATIVTELERELEKLLGKNQHAIAKECATTPHAICIRAEASTTSESARFRRVVTRTTERRMWNGQPRNRTVYVIDASSSNESATVYEKIRASSVAVRQKCVRCRSVAGTVTLPSAFWQRTPEQTAAMQAALSKVHALFELTMEQERARDAERKVDTAARRC